MKPAKFINRILMNNIVILILAVVVLTYFGISTILEGFEMEKAQIHSQAMESKKVLVERTVNEIFSGIEYNQVDAERILKKSIAEKVDNMHEVAMSIYESNHGVLPEEDIQSIIREALRDVRYNDGRGYFFIDTMDGDVILYPILPDLEGTNIIDLKDSEGNPVIQSEIKVARESGSGYVDGYWPRPEYSEKLKFKKVSYVKYFEPYDWYIGTGEYVDDVIEDLQQKALERAENMSQYGSSNLWFYEAGGKMLLHTELPGLEGIDFEMTEEPSIRAFYDQVANLMETSDQGFIEYKWPVAETEAFEQKIAFVLRVPEWEWVMGSSISLADLEQTIKNQEAQLQSEMLEYSVAIVIFSVVFFLVVLVLTRLMNKRVNNVLVTFTEFFEKSASNNRRIDTEKLDFAEFKNLGELANSMVDQRVEIQEKLVESQKQAALGRMIAGVAHEINTPLGNSLTTITYFERKTNDLKDDMTKGTLKKTTLQDYFEVVDDSLKILTTSIEAEKRIIDNFKRISMDQHKRSVKYIHLSKWMRNKVYDAGNRCSDAKCRIKLDIPDNLHVYSDPEILDLILENLVNHSLKYGFRGMDDGEISIRIQSATGAFRIHYSDNGHGIPRSMSDSIFDPYAATDRLSSEEGFNFHIVYNLITQVLHGSIAYKGDEETGLLFEIELPNEIEIAIH